MIRTRIVPAAMLLGVVGLGIAVLTAAKEVGDRTDVTPPKPAVNATDALVCIGYADTEDRMVHLFPKNFPQPSVVKKVKAREGMHVVEGQDLLEFDDEFYQLKIQEAEAKIASAKAKQAEAEAAIKAHHATVKAMYKELLATAEDIKAKQAELDEAERLKVTPPLEIASRKAAVQTAQFRWEGAKEKYEALLAQPPTELVESAKTLVVQAENGKQQAEQALKVMSCKAPANGTIIRSFVADGAIFGPQTREPAFWFLKDSDIIVRAEVTQEFARRVIVGQSAEVADEADSKQTWKGKVTKVGDHFLTKRTGHSPTDLLQMSDERVLECIVVLEKKNDMKPPRYGQKVRITLSD